MVFEVLFPSPPTPPHFIFLSRYTPPRRPNCFHPAPPGGETILASSHGRKMAVGCHAWGKVFGLRAETGLSWVSAEALENVQNRLKARCEIVLTLQGTAAAFGWGGGRFSAAATAGARVCHRPSKRQLEAPERLAPTPCPAHPAAHRAEARGPLRWVLAPCEPRAWVELRRQAQPTARL